MTIDVIIPTWNSAPMLEESLCPILKHLRPRKIIIVDRESTDRTRKVAERFGCCVLTDTTSLGSARMTGVNASTAEWIAFIDDDIVLPDDFRRSMEKFMEDDVGAIQAGAISVYEPYHTIQMEEFSGRMGERDHFDYFPGERGFTNATLIRRELLDGLDLSNVNAWEDWVITQRVLSKGYRWIVVRPFVEHIHYFDDLAAKEGWNAAGILNMARTGHMSSFRAMKLYLGKVVLALKGALKYTIKMRQPAQFKEYMMFIAHILAAPCFVLRAAPRLPRVSRDFELNNYIEKKKKREIV